MRFYTTADLAAASPNLMARSFTANLMRIEPNGAAPMLALSGMARERTIRAVAHSYYSKSALFPSIVLTAEAAPGDTTLATESNDEILPNSVLLALNIQPGTYGAPEIIRVVSKPNATDVEVVRGASDTTALTLPVGTRIIEIGSMFEEGSAKPPARSITMAEHTNFAQIFRDTWDITETAAAVQVEPSVTMVSENKEDGMFFHGSRMEWSAIFGRKSATTINNRPARTMDGIEAIVQEFAPGNVNAAGATTTYKQLEAMLHPTLDSKVNGRGYGRKTLFVGRQALQVINEIGRASGYYELVRNNTTFGMSFYTFTTSRGEWELIEHPLLNAHDETAKMCIVADLASMDFLWLRRTTHKDTAFDGEDSVSGVYTSELTIELPNPLGWGIIYNLSAGA